MSTTTIRIAESTKKRLLSVGKMGDSFDDVIRRLLDRWKEEEDVARECTCDVGSGAHSGDCGWWEFLKKEGRM